MRHAGNDASRHGETGAADSLARDAGGMVKPWTLSTDTRFAIYLTPSGRWNTIGNLWLGRDADRDRLLSRDWLAALPDTLHDAEARPLLSASLIDDWTADPRRYGLHATLKPPFRLTMGQTVAALDAALRSLAASRTMFDLPIRLDALRGFLAWQPSDDVVARGPLQSLADACVRELDRFRALPTEQERARRLKKGGARAQHFSAREQAHLARWGYPYVFDTFRFHITLTNRLDAATEQRARRVLTALAASTTVQGALEGVAGADASRADRAMVASESLAVRDISLFVQPRADLPFVVARHYGFDGSIRNGAGAGVLCT